MLRIAIQNKGRLNEESVELLNGGGVMFDNPKRKYLVASSTFPAEILYLRDDDIPGVVASGTAQLGIVGLNEVEEKGYNVEVVKRLGFGYCRLCLAIPKGENYNGPEYFAGKRIATSSQQGRWNGRSFVGRCCAFWSRQNFRQAICAWN